MNLKPGIRYIVTKSGDDETIIKDDIIKADSGGTIFNFNANGWIYAEHVEEAMKGVEAKVDITFYHEKRNLLRKQIEEIEKLLLEESCTQQDTE